MKFEREFLKLLVRLVVNLIEYFKSYSFRRQFRRQFSTVFHVIYRHHRMVLWPLPCKFCKVWASISKVINEISVKFAWVFQYIYSFRRQFRRQFSTVFHVILQAPSAGTTATAQYIWRSLIEYFKSYKCKTLSQRCDNAGGPFFVDISVNPNRFTCNFAHTIRSHCGDCPENLVKFDQVFQKLLMWCTETTLFPRRHRAENAGRHWNSTEEVPSPIVHVWLSS